MFVCSFAMRFHVSSLLFAAATTLIGGGSLSVSVSAIDVGEKFPEGLNLHHGFPPESISLDERLSGKNVLLVGLPGAFTPT